MNTETHHTARDTSTVEIREPEHRETGLKTVEVMLINDGLGCFEHDGKVFHNKESIGFNNGVFGQREPKRIRVILEPIYD